MGPSVLSQGLKTQQLVMNHVLSDHQRRLSIDEHSRDKVDAPRIEPEPNVWIDRLGYVIIGPWIAKLVSIEIFLLPAVYVEDTFICKSVG